MTVKFTKYDRKLTIKELEIFQYSKLSPFSIHKTAFFPILFLFLLYGCSPIQMKLQEGDLLFTVSKEESELVSAIKNSTSTATEIAFSHVGIVKIEGENVFVIEATSPDGVVKTPLNHFLQSAAKWKEKPLVAVGRLKAHFQYLVPRAIERAEGFLSSPYDFAYEEGNNAFYCSELVRFSFLDSIDQPVFAPLAMSFKDKQTGKTNPYWITHFHKLNKDVPEGKPGTNPADMAKSPIIEIVYTYYPN